MDAPCMSAGLKACKDRNAPSTSCESRIHIHVVLLFPCHDCRSLSIVNIDDADDEYDNCDTFGNYNAHTQEIDHVEQEPFAIGEYIRFMYVKSFLIHFSAGSSTLQQLTTPLVPSNTPPETASLSDLPVGSAGHARKLPQSHETPANDNSRCRLHSSLFCCRTRFVWHARCCC